MLKKEEPAKEDSQNISGSVSIPLDAWEIIRNQAASLKSKDEQMNEMLDLYKKKDQQINEVIGLLKEQIKKGEGADERNPVAPEAALG